MLVKHIKVTRQGLEPRTFWIYIKCSNHWAIQSYWIQVNNYYITCYNLPSIVKAYIVSFWLIGVTGLWPWPIFKSNVCSKWIDLANYALSTIIINSNVGNCTWNSDESILSSETPSSNLPSIILFHHSCSIPTQNC